MLGRARRGGAVPDVRAVSTASATATAALTMKASRQCTVASRPPIRGASDRRSGLDAREGAHRAREQMRRHDLGQRREQERRQECIRGALHEPRGHEHRQRGRCGRDQRAHRVGDEAGAHDARHSQALPDRARDQLQGGERDQIGGNGRRDGIAGGMERLLQLRHEDAQDGSAERPHEAPDVERKRGVAGRHGYNERATAAGARDRLPRPASSRYSAGPAGRVPACSCVCASRTSDPSSYAANDL